MVNLLGCFRSLHRSRILLPNHLVGFLLVLRRKILLYFMVDFPSPQRSYL